MTVTTITHLMKIYFFTKGGDDNESNRLKHYGSPDGFQQQQI